MPPNWIFSVLESDICQSIQNSLFSKYKLNTTVRCLFIPVCIPGRNYFVKGYFSVCNDKSEYEVIALDKHFACILYVIGSIFQSQNIPREFISA